MSFWPATAPAVTPRTEQPAAEQRTQAPIAGSPSTAQMAHVYERFAPYVSCVGSVRGYEGRSKLLCAPAPYARPPHALSRGARTPPTPRANSRCTR